MYQGELLSYFPTNESIRGPRSGQTAVLNEIHKVIQSGKKLIILEGPVGCGKSAIAVTISEAFKDAHIITPRKSLQDQYYDDFGDRTVLMKGRGSYPCTFGVTPSAYKRVAVAIAKGRVTQPSYGEANCSNAPCKGSKVIYNNCVGVTGECPYTLAIETAQDSPAIIHNLHSFIYQTAYAEKFQKRQVLIIDEAHEISGTIRDFITRKFAVHIPVQEGDRPQVTNDIDSWANFFSEDRFVPVMSRGEIHQKAMDPDWVTPIEEYTERVLVLRAQKDYYKEKFSVKATINMVGTEEISTTFEFVPANLGSAPRDLLFNYGEYVILMSGTVYGKETFCRELGIDPDSAHYIRISSTFPKDNRPIYCKPEYQVDTSFKCWNDNFSEMIQKMSEIMSIFSDAKGLIHAPSYDAAQQIVKALPGSRAVTHTSRDFQHNLKDFYDSPEPLVFVSPVCQQGVDFKDDRARFQIVTRVPYLNTSDEFVKYKVENDFMWYNAQALIVWGQQLGRINRSEGDYGATFLMDTRFNSFIRKNSKVIPKWVKEAIIYK
jgi:Rad3-related DNA helicase